MTVIKHPLSNAKWKYNKHKAQSKYRNIGFEFTFEEWYDWWLQNGVDKNIDIEWNGKNRPCMCRIGDIGPYRADNVYYDTAQANWNHMITNGRHNAHGRKTKKNYRWGAELITLETLQNKHNIVNRADWPIYRADKYDENNLKESKRLFAEFKRIPARLYWETDKGRYRTLKEAADTEQIYIGTMKHRFEMAEQGYVHKTNQYDYKKYRIRTDKDGQVINTVEDYIKKYSRFPDPILDISGK